LKLETPDDRTSCVEHHPFSPRLGGTGVNVSKKLASIAWEVGVAVTLKSLVQLRLEANAKVLNLLQVSNQIENGFPMRLPQAGRILGNLVGSVHDVPSWSLSETIQLANDRAIIEVQIERRSILECMEWHRHLGWHWLDHWVCQIGFLDDSINECALCEFIGPNVHLLNAEATLNG
jgi:hypothetical protein